MRKRWGRRLLAFLLAVLLLCGLVFTASGSSVVYLMSVNDTIVPGLTASNMPLYSGNQLYIPYIMLTTQVNLGVRAQYNASRGVLTLTGANQIVTFDIRKNLATDESGANLDVYAIGRGSMVFIPLDWLCRYFPDLGYSLSRTPYGILVRLTNSAALLDDMDLVDAADTLLRQNLQSYQNSLATATPTATASPSPTPTTGPSSPPPSTEPDPTPLVYLAFRWGAAASDVADVLELYQQRALFLFTANEMLIQDDLIRRLAGRGHQIGLVLTGDNVENCMTQLALGQQLLSDISRGSLLIVSADELTRTGRQQLEDAGYALWDATLNGDGLTQSAILKRLSATEKNYVQLSSSVGNLTLVNSLLRTLSGSGYRLRQALAPVI